LLKEPLNKEEINGRRFEMNEKNNSNNKITILIVEDSPTQLEQLRYSLETYDYKVITAVNGKLGLEAALRDPPAIIISDIVMPEMNGYELCKAIRADDTIKDTPIVLLTSLSSPADVIEALKSGADNFIRKPYDEKHLILRVNNILTNRKLRTTNNVRVGVELYLGGDRHFITSERQQILDLLISTYEQAVELCGSLKLREQQLDRANNILSGIYNIAKGLNSAASEKEVLEGVLERAMELPDVKAGWIFIRNADCEFKLAVQKGLIEELNMWETLEGDCLCQRKVLSGEIDKSLNILECERLLHSKNKMLGLRSHVTLPLRIGKEVLGIMNLVGEEDVLFSEDDLRVLNGIGNQIGTALERCRIHEHLEELVKQRTSALTEEIEERKKIEYERERLIAILEATPDLVGLADINGNIKYTNPSGKKMLGLEPDEDITRVTVAETHPDWARKIVLDEGFPAAAKEGSWSGETALLHRKGFEIPISQIVIAHKSSKGKVEYYSTIARDITERKQYEKELIEKTILLESFFDNTLTLIVLLDKDFNFIRVNKAYADTDKQDVDFFIGKNHFDLYPSDAKEIFEEVLRTKTAYHAIERLFLYANNPERGITYWDWNLVPLLDENGEVESLIFTLLNVTVRVKAKEELIKNERFLTTLFNSVNDGIFTVNMSGRTIKSVNKAVCDLFGYDPGELMGKSTHVLYHSNEAFQEHVNKLSAAIKENKQFVRAELKLQKKDGTLIFCDVQTTLLKSSGIDDLVISVLRDITDKKKMIDELIAAKEKAEEMNEVKTLFFANMSHELRTPFVGIMGYAELLVDELKDPDQNEMAQGILSTSKRMMDTLTKILTISKLEIKEIEAKKENVNLNELFDSIHTEYFAAANKKNILIEKTVKLEDAVVQSDKSLLFDILHNLVSNAINYTDEGKISISADKKIKSNKEILVINVSDTGIGIPKDKQEIVWQEFRQASEGRTRIYEGTGLGLTIVKKHAELLGGAVSLQSEEGKGSTFSVELPV
jgi:PAS domain S-box-containing protein